LNRHHLQVIEKSDKRSRPNSPDIVELGSDIELDAEVLDGIAQRGFLAVHHDLLVVCAAIEYADRRWKRPSTWARDLNVTVPVIELDIWQMPRVIDDLQRVLRHITGDRWTFNFVTAQNRNPYPWRQLKFDFGNSKSFAIAYSEGLDSRAVSALSGTSEEALCIRVSKKSDKPKVGEFFFTRIPFRVNIPRAPESSFRSRGFQFAAITAIAAHIRNLKRIVVPESGQGVLGPAMLPPHRLYADYRNHPTFFRRMEHFVRLLLGHEVVYEQPRIWSTKGQTALAFLALPDRTADQLINTRSCWQSRSVVNVDGKHKQCGLCAACILRRFSLHAAGIREPSENYVVANLSTSRIDTALKYIPNSRDRANMINYGIVGTRHFQRLADARKFPDEDLLPHCVDVAEAMDTTYSETLENLKSLLQAHALEWRRFLDEQGPDSFLCKWLAGQADD
jgi:7-cyano-7-deazaguanine synthase in queuosine biosynthesis